MTAESLPRQSKFRYTAAANSCPLSPLTPPNSLFHTLDLAGSSPFFPSIIPSLLPGLVDIYLERARFPRVLHVVLRVSECEALWSTSISITCQDLWVMESKPDCSESVLLKLTSGPLWAIMDEHHSHPLPLPYTRVSFGLSFPQPYATFLSPSLIPLPSPQSSHVPPFAGLGHSFRHNGNSIVKNE